MMPNQQETSIAWLAGIFDGEAWIGFNVRRKHHTERGKVKPHILPWITVSSITPELIERCFEITSSLGIGCNRSNAKRFTKAGNPIWSIHWAGAKRVGALLPLVLPYLTCKRKAAETVLAFVHSRRMGKKSVTYTELEWNLVHVTREGSSETTREARLNPLRLSVEDIVRSQRNG